MTQAGNRFLLGFSLIFALLFFMGCSKDDKPTDSGNGAPTGPSAELSAALSSINQDYFQANSATFNSMEALHFYVISAINTTLEVVASNNAVAMTGCLGNLEAGMTYTFDGQAYVLSAISGAPADGARLLLYEADSLGNLNLEVQIGYLEIVCADAPFSLSLKVVTGSVEILELTFSGSPGYYTSYGILRTPEGSGFFDFNIQLDGYEYEKGASLNIEAPGLIIGYGTRKYYDYNDPSIHDSTYIGMGIIKQDIGGNRQIQWEVLGGIYTTPGGTITNGNLIISDQYGVGTFVGCFSGTVVAPTIQAADQAGCVQFFGDYPVGTMTQSAIADNTAAFIALSSVYETLMSFVEIGLFNVEF